MCSNLALLALITGTGILPGRPTFPFYFGDRLVVLVSLRPLPNEEMTAMVDKMAAILVLPRLLLAMLELLLMTSLVAVVHMAAILGRLLLRIHGRADVLYIQLKLPSAFSH